MAYNTNRNPRRATMSTYVKLMSERKKALFKGDEAKADRIYEAIKKLVAKGEVTKEEFVAGAYL
jgi:hypothetical protein